LVVFSGLQPASARIATAVAAKVLATAWALGRIMEAPFLPALHAGPGAVRSPVQYPESGG
jgi:hypothetical protein